MNVQILKYDPSVDTEPHYADYEVPYKEHITVLEVVSYIYENLDPVAFDYSCRGRVCGRCAMMLDDEPVMACYTPISEERDIRLEPLRGYPIIRDLVVDKSTLHSRLSGFSNRVRHKPLTDGEIDRVYDPTVVEKVNALEWCCRCGCCQSSCPVLMTEGGQGAYAGPAGMAALGLRFYDPNDEGDRVIEAVSEGLFSCILCGKCDEVCPASEIEHVELHRQLMDEAETRGLKP
ncbi:MAG: 4Fe-4S dicluster domain-containing protein [Coriobacteriales bacterium]|nr:4Fe-4S dicluster domain-containing protein [Coriobacteriales bacterium]